MPVTIFPAPGALSAVQHLDDFGAFDLTPSNSYRYTNLLTWSEDLTKPSWTRISSNTVVSSDYNTISFYANDDDILTSNGINAFRNNDNSHRITVTASNSSFGQTINVLPNTDYTLSFYAKNPALTWTPVMFGGVVQDTNNPRTFYKASGNANILDGQLSSTQGFRTAYLSFTAQPSNYFSIGLNKDPLADRTSLSLDYAFRFDGNANGNVIIERFFGNAQVPWGSAITFTNLKKTTASVYSIIYDGTNVSFLVNNTILFSFVDSNQIFYLDSSFYTVGGNLTGVENLVFSSSENTPLSVTASNVFYRIIDATTSSNIVQSTNYFGNLTTAGTQQFTDTWSRIVVPFTTGPTCTLVKVNLVDDRSSTGSVDLYWPQLELGTAATDYNSTQSFSAASLGLTSLSSGPISAVSGNLTDYIDTEFDFPPIINILGVSTITYDTAGSYQFDLDLFTTNVTTSSTKILYIPEQLFPPYLAGETIRLTDSATGLIKTYTVSACTTRTVTIATSDYISEKLVILAKTSGSIYSQDKILNDARLYFFAGNVGSSRVNYYISTYFGVPYRATKVLGSDNPDYRVVDSRPVDTIPSASFTRTGGKLRDNSGVYRDVAQKLSVGNVRNPLYNLRGINLESKLHIHNFSPPSIRIFLREGLGPKFTLTSLLQKQIVKLATGVEIRNTTEAYSTRVRFISDRDITNYRYFLDVAELTLINKLAGLPLTITNFTLNDTPRLNLRFNEAPDLRRSLAQIDSPFRFSRFAEIPDSRQKFNILDQIPKARIFAVHPKETLLSFAQLNLDKIKLLPADRYNTFFIVGQARQLIKPENIAGYEGEDVRRRIGLVEKRINTQWYYIDKSQVLRIESNTVSITRNNMANVTTLTSKSSYTPSERLLIDLLKPVYRTQFINTNVFLDALDSTNYFATQKIGNLDKKVTTQFQSFLTPVADSLQRRFTSLVGDGDRTLRLTARLGRLAMANVAMPISSHIEKNYYRPIPLRVPTKFSVTGAEGHLSRVARAFMKIKLVTPPNEAQSLKPGYSKLRVNMGFVADNLGKINFVDTFTNIKYAIFADPNDRPLRKSTGGLNKYINENISLPPMEVLGQSGFTNDLVQLYLDDNDILTITAGNTMPTQTVTINPVVKLESPAVYFDGYQDYIETVPSASLGFGTTPVTIEMFIRPMAMTSLQVITSLWSNTTTLYRDKVDIYLNSQLQVCVGVVYPRSTDFFSTNKGVNEVQLFFNTVNTLSTSVITHLAIVAQNNQVNIYFNGVQQAIVGSNQVMLPSGNSQLRIGYAGAPSPTFTFVSNI